MLNELLTINTSSLGETDILLRIVLQCFLFLGSALFSMSETALFALKESDFDSIDRTHPKRANMLRGLLDEPRQLIISILCGNELINIAATINLAGIFLVLYPDASTAALASTLVMLPLLLLFGEITPKTIAVNNPTKLCVHLVGPIISYWVRIVAPLRAIIRFVSDFFTTLIVGKAQERSSIIQSDDFKSLLHDMSDETGINSKQRKLIHHMLDASVTDIKEVMVPRPQIFFIDADWPIDRILEAFRKERHRRVPVFKQHRDNVIGILRDNKILEAINDPNLNSITIDDILEPANFIIDTTTISESAEFFKSGEHHALMVINEFGGVEGLVSADDVFGYLIYGRATFLKEAEITHVEDENSYYCPGFIPLRTLATETSIDIDDNRFNTLNGYVTNLVGRLPTSGDQVCDEQWRYEVLEMDGLRISHCKITTIHELGSSI